jgi:hypothetical protein
LHYHFLEHIRTHFACCLAVSVRETLSDAEKASKPTNT